MKNLFLGGFFITTLIFSSCTKNITEENSEVVQIVTPVEKTENMLNFENSLKNWFQSQNEVKENSLSKKTNTNTNLIIENNSKKLLEEIGINQNVIESKSKLSNEELVTFAMEEYSKKLSEMYNQNKK